MLRVYRLEWCGTGRRRNHADAVLLRVDLEDGAWLADVGFGEQTLTGPVRMERTSNRGRLMSRIASSDATRAVAAGKFELLRLEDPRGAASALSVRSPAAAARRLRSGELVSSTHPSSAFVNGTDGVPGSGGRRYTLFNNNLAVHRLGGESERRTLATAGNCVESDRHPPAPLYQTGRG